MKQKNSIGVVGLFTLFVVCQSAFLPWIPQKLPYLQTGVFSITMDGSSTTSNAIVILDLGYSDNLYRKFFGMVGLTYQTYNPSFEINSPACTNTYFNFTVSLYQVKAMTFNWDLKFHYMTSGSQYNTWIFDDSQLIKQPTGNNISNQVTLAPNKIEFYSPNPFNSKSLCNAFLNGLQINTTETTFGVDILSVVCNSTVVAITISYSEPTAISVKYSLFLANTTKLNQLTISSNFNLVDINNRTSIPTAIYNMTTSHVMIGFSALRGTEPTIPIPIYSSIYNSINFTNQAENTTFSYDLSYIFLSNFTCPQNSSLNGSSCICNPKFFQSGSLCFACDILCQNCTSTTNCQVCMNNNFRTPVGGMCVCIDGYFSDGNAAICQKCLNVCATCNQSNKCLTCIDSSVRNISKNCSCRNQYFQSPYNSSCVACLFPCSQCLGPTTDSTCTACVGWGRDTAIDCNCIIGYYEVGLNNCNACNYRCYSCNQSTKCLICKIANQRDLNSYPNCVCNPGYYDNGASANCANCYQTCKTCVATSISCTSCYDTQYRELNNNNCICIAGYYEIQAPINYICAKCYYPCATCDKLSYNCTSCAPNANRNSSSPSNYCACSDGFYDTGVTICVVCNYKCATCNNGITCLTCPALSQRNQSSATCACSTGYFESNVPICGTCPAQCINCTSQSNCLACKSWYAFKNGKCLPQVVTIFYLKFMSLKANEVLINVVFNSSVTFTDVLENVMKVNVGNQNIKFSGKIINSTLLEIRFNISDFQPFVLITFSSNTVYDTNVLPMFPQYNAQLMLTDVPFYSQTDLGLLAFLQSLLSGLNKILTGCRFAAALVGCSFLLVYLLEFINVVTLYLFLDIAMPHNFRTTLITLYNSFDFKMMPFSVSFNSNTIFKYPKAYLDSYYSYEFSLDFMDHFLSLIIQFGILFSFYLILNWLRKFLNCNHWFARILRIRFGPSLYSNCIMVYLSFHTWFGFAAASSFLDLNLSTAYRTFNIFISVIWLFFTFMILFAHPAWLALEKTNYQINTMECYWEVRRRQSFSELFVFNRLLVPTTMAVLTPLVHPLVTLISVLALIMLKCSLIFFIKFRCFRHKLHYITNGVLHFILHVTILGFYSAANTLQKMNVRAWSGFGFFAVVLVCVIILLELLHIFLELIAIAEVITKRFLPWDQKKVMFNNTRSILMNSTFNKPTKKNIKHPYLKAKSKFKQGDPTRRPKSRGNDITTSKVKVIFDQSANETNIKLHPDSPKFNSQSQQNSRSKDHKHHVTVDPTYHHGRLNTAEVNEFLQYPGTEERSHGGQGGGGQRTLMLPFKKFEDTLRRY